MSKKLSFKVTGITCLGLLLLFTTATAQIKDIIETTIPKGWTTKYGKVKLSEKRFKTGKQSLQWDWKKPNAQITIIDTAFGGIAKDDRSTFVIWVYNENPIKDHLRFEFLKGDKTVNSFNFNLNFRGWRTAWVMYHRDMEGKPIADMNKMVIHAPSSVKKGTLFLDQMMFNVNINPRSPMRDEQVPFVALNSDNAANSHWTALYTFSQNPHYLPLPSEVTARHQEDIRILGLKYQDIILPKEKAQKVKLTDIEKDFAFWHIVRKENTITGRAVRELNDTELYADKADREERNNFKKHSIESYTKLMIDVATLHCLTSSNEEQKRLTIIFMDLLDHAYDQGWAAGSGMGAVHHLGYAFRDFYSSCLLMRPAIKASGKLERTQATMAWFSGLGRSRTKPEEVTNGNIDVFNTLLGSMLSAILIMDNSPEKICQLHEFSNWLSKSIMPNTAIEGTFKPDYAVFHHGTLYPAYAVGGFQGITPIVYTLSNTAFDIKPEAKQALKNMLLMMSYYTNPIKWPVSVSGRHPTGTWKIPDEAYFYMAQSGSPDGKDHIDKEMAAIYLKILGDKENSNTQNLKKIGIKPADYAQGHWNLNYGLFDIHRRDNWLLTVKGHNRYIVSHESYPGANIFGRYFSYGQLEVTYPQTKDDNGDSFKDEGWDWNNMPGTTTLHVPLDKLRANIINADDFSGVEEMLLSDEVFAGGTNIDNTDGMFAMKLHGSDKYDMGSFSAIKSWFMFDDLVIALGSNISNNIKEHSTQTTVFQNYLTNKTAQFNFDGLSISSFPLEKKWSSNSNALTILDNRKVGYYIPNAKALVFTKKEQLSRDQKDLKETKGNLAKLIFNHGEAPKNDRYHYAMLIKTDASNLLTFKSKMNSEQPVYKILQQDSIAHLVFYAPKNSTAQAIFKANQQLKDSLLVTTDRACLVMYQMNESKVKLSVTDPDLAFYLGPDDTTILPNGKRKEESIYSKPWITAPSQPTVVNLIVKGLWKAWPDSALVKTVFENGNTVLSIQCKYGMASQFTLIK